jgi:hypothetical protein
LPPSRAPSAINRIARDTTADVPAQAGVPGDTAGRHRRQGRNPAASAAAAEANQIMLLGLANGTGQMERQ